MESNYTVHLRRNHDWAPVWSNWNTRKRTPFSWIEATDHVWKDSFLNCIISEILNISNLRYISYIWNKRQGALKLRSLEKWAQVRSNPSAQLFVKEQFFLELKGFVMFHRIVFLIISYRTSLRLVTSEESRISSHPNQWRHFSRLQSQDDSRFPHRLYIR